MNYWLITKNQNNGSEKSITHLLSQVLFYKDQLKFKHQIIDILIQQLSKRDKAHLKEQLHHEQRTTTLTVCTSLVF